MDAGTAFIPHHRSAFNADWEDVCRQLGIRYIDPGAHVDVVVREIRRSNSIVTEAMHGAILADTFGIPWKAVSCYDHIFSFKWEDWCASLGLTYRPDRLPAIWDVDRGKPAFVRFKNNVKRSLGVMGIRHPAWTPPGPAKSSRRNVARLVEAFSNVLEKGEFGLSDRVTFAARVDALYDALMRLKQEYRCR
jgi:succinoglycan biosynthesis protein ExoV